MCIVVGVTADTHKSCISSLDSEGLHQLRLHFPPRAFNSEAVVKHAALSQHSAQEEEVEGENLY